MECPPLIYPAASIEPMVRWNRILAGRPRKAIRAGHEESFKHPVSPAAQLRICLSLSGREAKTFVKHACAQHDHQDLIASDSGYLIDRVQTVEDADNPFLIEKWH